MPHTHLSEEMKKCIEACRTCSETCLSMAANHCLETGGKHVAPKHFRLMLDCAEICDVSAHFMLRNSAHHELTCGVCAQICQACADNCAEIGDMDSCVQACRNCAETCRQMAA